MGPTLPGKGTITFFLRKKEKKKKWVAASVLTATGDFTLPQLHSMDSSRQPRPRWRPTEEQQQVLKEMLRLNGGRAITWEEALQVAPPLQWFGAIEPRNVYYWFQNHRQKMTRQGTIATKTEAPTRPISQSKEEEVAPCQPVQETLPLFPLKAGDLNKDL